MENFQNELWQEYKKTKSHAVKDELIKQYAYLIKLVVGRISIYTNSQIEYDDLLSYGVFGLIDAIEKFDYEKGIKFETYASLRIRGEIIDNIRKIDWIPRSLRQKNKLLETTITDFEVQNGREPSNEELARILNISLNEVEILVKNSSIYNLISLDEYLDQAKEKATFKDSINPIKTPEQELDEEQSKLLLAEVIDSLPENQKRVITLYYYEELTLKEIGKVMNISESRVSQIHSKTIKILKSKLGNREEFFY